MLIDASAKKAGMMIHHWVLTEKLVQSRKI
jgi:hypothetical protein